MFRSLFTLLANEGEVVGNGLAMAALVRHMLCCDLGLCTPWDTRLSGFNGVGDWVADSMAVPCSF